MDAKRRPSAAPAAAKAAPKTLSWFTLVELIVVITILAILATIGFLALSGYSQDAKDASVKANVRSVHTAIASESAVTGNSPRYYVSHDAAAALTGSAVAYVDGTATTLTGGDWNVSGTNYSAGNPDWTKLKLNPEKFRLSNRPPMGGFLSLGSLLPDSFAAYDSKSLSVGAVDAALAPTANGRARSASFFQVAGTAPATGTVSVTGNFPAPTPAQVASGAVSGLVKAPTGTGALVDGYSSGGSSSSSSSGGGAVNGACWSANGTSAVSAPAANLCTAGTASAVSASSSWTWTCAWSNGGTTANCSATKACPTGFVKVPGNASFSTAAQDFCLAKYEMKFANTAQSAGQCGGTPGISCDGEAAGDGWKTWQFATGATYASAAAGTPVADLTQGQAIAACQSLGAGYHLVTNDEWMAAARSAESVAANWSGGGVGNGGMFRGNTGVDDVLGCNDAGTDYVAAAATDNASLSNTRSSCADKRQLKLANGEIVWDMAGNVWEHVNGANTLDGSNYATMPGNVCSATVDNWFSFAGTDGAGGGTCSFTAPYSYAGYGPATAGMNAANGIGRIYSYKTGGTDRVLRRGSDGNHGDYAGVFAMYMTWGSAGSGRGVGFRCAFR